MPQSNSKAACNPGMTVRTNDTWDNYDLMPLAVKRLYESGPVPLLPGELLVLVQRYGVRSTMNFMMDFYKRNYPHWKPEDEYDRLDNAVTRAAKVSTLRAKRLARRFARSHDAIGGAGG